MTAASRRKDLAIPVFCLIFPCLYLVLCLFPETDELVAAEPSFVQQAEKRVVILYSTARDFPATEQVERGISEGLAGEKKLSLQLSSEYLELSRFRDRGHDKALADLLRQRYGSSKIDLVIGVDTPAATFLMDHADLFPASPVLLCSLPETLRNRIRASSLTNRVIGIFEPVDALRQLVRSIVRFKPETRQIYLVSGVYENDQMRADTLRQAVAAVAGNIRLIDLTGYSIGQILEKCEQLPPDSVLLFSTMFVDANGHHFIPKAVLRSIAAHTNAPVFGPYESFIGNGIIGGPLISLRMQGKKAAETALRLLRGQEIQNPDGLGADTWVNLYDWRLLQRHAIDESLLPPNSTVLFREATLWELYRHYIIGVLLVLAVQSILIVGLVFNLRQRKKAQAALCDSQKALKNLAGRLISSQEEELSRLSREFHDDYAQRLAAMAIETGTLELQAAGLNAPIRDQISLIKGQLINLSDDIHALSRELHPAILKDLGLARAVRSLCLSFSDREEIPVTSHIADLPANIPQDTALCVYRVIQEGLRNIAKHAHARNVDVFVRCTPNHLLASIEDDGTGFDPGCARHTPGIGLASMRERVQHAQGEFTIQSAPGQGTTIHLSVPLPRRDHEETTRTPR